MCTLYTCNVHRSTVYNSQGMETTQQMNQQTSDSATQQPSAYEWIRRLQYIYTMEYYSAVKKNIFESVLMMWMKLEPIKQSEKSQREKHQYSVLTHIYGIQRDGNDKPVCKTAKETQMYRTVKMKKKKKKLKIVLLFDSEILLLGIYCEQTIIQKDIYTTVFIAALSTTART